MAFKKIKVDAPKNTSEWEWPLTTGIVGDQARLLPQLRQGNWSSQFSKFRVIQQNALNAGKSNVLFFADTKAALDFFKSNIIQRNAKAAVIIIKVEKSFFDQEKDWTKIDKLSKVWMDITGANGLFFVHPDKPIEQWYDEFIVELSHNKNVTDAIETLNDESVRAYISPQLNKQTRLSNYIIDLGHQLENTIAKDPSREIKVDFPGIGQKSFKQKDLGRFLAKNAAQFSYDHESGIANTVKDIKEKLEEPIIFEFLDIPAYQQADSSVGNVLYDYEYGSRRGSTSLPKREITAPPPAPRFFRAHVLNKSAKTIVTDYLIPKKKYSLKISIGPAEADWVNAEEAVPDAELFKDKKTRKVTIDLEIFLPHQEIPLHKKISLPREGNSNTASVDFTTATDTNIFEASIFAYHQSRLIQQLKFRIAIVASDTQPVIAKPELKTSVLLRKNLDNLSDRTAFSTSIVLPEETDEKKAVAGLHKKKPIGFRYSADMKNLVEKIRNTIEEIALFSEKTDLEDPDNIRLMIRLANQGHLLYSLYLDNLQLDGPLQLVSNNREYLPLDFAYTLRPPQKDASLCKNARKGLLDGKCNCSIPEEKQANYICPFGFWAFSRVVERHQFSRNLNGDEEDYIIRAEIQGPEHTLDILKNMLFASTRRVDNVVPESYQKMKESLTMNAANAHEATGWKEWKAKASDINPDTLVLVVHIEEDEDLGVDALEIADRDMLAQTHLDEYYLNTIDGKSTPFVVLIGCEAVNTNAYMFDTVSYVLRKGAAIVLSNFTKIKGEVATGIVQELVEVLKKEAHKTIRFGEIVLKLRQQLLAKGVMMSLTLLAHGDADWKVRV